MPRHIITDSERGHRPRLSKDENTVKFTLYLTESQKIKAKKLGQDWFKKKIDNS